MRWRKAKPRISAKAEAGLRDAITGDGLLVFSRNPQIVWTRRIWPLLDNKPFRLDDSEEVKRCGLTLHSDRALAPLWSGGWMIHNKNRTGHRYRTSKVKLGSLAVFTPFGESFLPRQLLDAGLFVSKEEVESFSERQKTELQVWADMRLEGSHARARSERRFYWIEVLLRSPFEPPLAVQRTIERERIVEAYRWRHGAGGVTVEELDEDEEVFSG